MMLNNTFLNVKPKAANKVITDLLVITYNKGIKKHK